MAERPPAADLKMLTAGVREALTLADLHSARDDQEERTLDGGFSLDPDSTSVRVSWSPHDDLDAATWTALEKDPHHALVIWEDRTRETMLRAMSDILWSAGFTVAFTPEIEPDGIVSGSWS